MKEKGQILVYGSLTASMEYILQGNGYGITQPATGEELEHMLETGESSLFLFSPESWENLPENLALLRRLREKSKLPMLVAFQKSSDEIRIMALNAGADDCIGPDCSVLEALARIQAQIRCYSRLLAAHKQTRTIRLAGLEVDDGAKKVRVEGNDVRLTPTEYKILCLLLEQPGRVLSNRQIYEKIWKMAPIGADNVVAVHIRHIREKIEENPENPRYLKVVWGQGYKVG